MLSKFCKNKRDKKHHLRATPTQIIIFLSHKRHISEVKYLSLLRFITYEIFSKVYRIKIGALLLKTTSIDVKLESSRNDKFLLKTWSRAWKVSCWSSFEHEAMCEEPGKIAGSTLDRSTMTPAMS